MSQVAKLFMNGRSQAVRLPVNYRFDGDEVYIRHDPTTGDVVLSKKPNTWYGFFAALDTVKVPNDFTIERDNEAPIDRDLF